MRLFKLPTSFYQLHNKHDKVQMRETAGNYCKLFNAISGQFDKMKFQEMMEQVEAKRIDNFQFRFLRNYMNMLMILLKFVYATWSRNWVLYLSSLTELLPGIISIDRIKYRRMLTVYLADMQDLQKSNPKLWKMATSAFKKINSRSLQSDEITQANKRTKF